MEPIRTGDLGRLDAEGRLHVIDRRTDRIVRGGENVAPAEVEAALLAHPAIAGAAVVARPDPVWGQLPVAAIVLREGATDPGDEALAAHCRRSLAGFKVPAAFQRLDALPLTGGGKVRREAVRALLADEPAGTLARPGGDAIGWRVTGTGPATLVLLPGTLSNAAQLDRLAAALAAPGDVTVHAVDRRGTGTGRLASPRPLDVAVHLGDLVAYLDARGIDRATVVGVSFGGVLALELAARHPGRVAAVVAYEPPYGAVADAPTLAWFRALAADTAGAHRTGGAPAAAETFLRAVAGDAAWERLSERARALLAREGDGALADAGLSGLRPDDLAGIVAPVTILTGGASEPFYAPIADALAARIPGARRDTLAGLAHPAPITDPAPVAAAARAALGPAGLVTPEPRKPNP
jgi:pimeloyl-ACP methyl ester carboxylesterase